MEHHAWESIQRHLQNTQLQELYGDLDYIISGEPPQMLTLDSTPYPSNRADIGLHTFLEKANVVISRC